MSGFKFFSEEDEDDKKSLQGKVQIMTMHKSKGDEFNLVFIPEMSEKSLPLSIGSINLKSADFIDYLIEQSDTKQNHIVLNQKKVLYRYYIPEQGVAFEQKKNEAIEVE